MKFSVIARECVGLLKQWSFVLLIPILIALDHKEFFIIPTFLGLFAATYVFSIIVEKSIKTKESAQLKEGLVVIGLCWLLITLIGSLVFFIHLDISFLDAFFESMSSWTTTGLSVLVPEHVPDTILFWRSFGQWIGGLGIVVLVAGSFFKSSNAIFIAEGRNDRIKPNIVNSLRIMGVIYVIYTFLGFVLLRIFGMSLFEALNHSMTAIATGGMSTNNNSIAGFYHLGIGVPITLIILMILGNISFFHHYHLLRGNFKKFFRSKQNNILFLLLIIGTLFVALRHTGLESLFHVASAIGTGFSTVNLTTWGHGELIVLIMLMIIGGVAGSTAGGIKIHRLGIMIQQFKNQFLKLIKPHRIVVSKFDGKTYHNDDIINIYNYVFVYIVILVVATMIFVGQGHAALPSLFEVASAQGNVGLDMGLEYGAVEKVTLIFVMWAGRLEIWAVLLSLLHLFSGGQTE